MSASAAEKVPPATRDANLRVLEELIVEATVKFFESCSVELALEATREEFDAGAEHTGFAGIIGFASERLRGNLVVYMGDDLVMATRPETVDTGVRGHAAMSDWTAEIANQLLGRFENSLIRYGTRVAPSVPSAVSGIGYTLTSLSLDTPRQFLFSCEHGNVNVFLNAQMHETLELVESTEEEPSEEGDLLLF